MRIGYLECFSGISGDMMLGALVDAGVPFACMEETTAALKVNARLEAHKVNRGGLGSTRIKVIVSAHHSHATHRSLTEILELINSAPLSPSVREHSARAFQILGEAEAAIHSIPLEKVHFHELGADDTIIDIVCSAVGSEQLGVDRWLSSPLNVGSGTVVCKHGKIPVPAPATLRLLGPAPIYASGAPMERVTPTGATILRMLDVHYQPLPLLRVNSSGYGAGEQETPGEPNLLRLIVGETIEEDPESRNAVPIAAIEAVIDDSNPQLIAYTSELLLAAGAWDVYHAAVQMKKGRTGIAITILAAPELLPALREILLRETTTIGLRWRIENKLALNREFLKVQTQLGEISIKIARLPDGTVANISPEYEDCARLAKQNSVPLKQVMQQAMQAYAAIAGNSNLGRENAR